MNRKQKIIVSTTGIFLVLLILVGLTYAYFLTRINGNTNDKSISVTTANLRLVYSDGTDGVIGGTNIEPSDTVYTKTFTVKSEGNKNIEYGVYLINVINQLTRKEDVKYTLECTTDGTITCNGVNETTFPSGISQLKTNTIEPGKTHTYTFKFTYKDTGTDQSIDMGKELSAKIQIFGKLPSGEYFPYEEETLSYNIINNAKNNLNGTEYLETPKTKVAEEISEWETEEIGIVPTKTSTLCSGYSSWLVGDSEATAQSGNTVSSYEEAVGKYVYDRCSGWTKYLESYDSTNSILNFRGKVIKYEKTLSKAEDDYGTSYYYRGNVIDNYVNFAGMCWRVVRIVGDGSVKLILEDQNTTCNDNSFTGNWQIGDGTIGYHEYEAGEYTASDGSKNSSLAWEIDYLNNNSMATTFKKFQTEKLSNYTNKLKSGDWCIGDAAYDTKDVSSTPLIGKKIFDTEIIENKSYYYDAYVRLESTTTKNPTLKCVGTNMSKFDNNTNMYVGTLTIDDFLYAGAMINKANMNYYLINEYFLAHPRFVSTMTLSSGYGYYFLLHMGSSSDGEFRTGSVNMNSGLLRPVINLKPGIKITGDGIGTKEKPYVIE